ncbi:MAG: hypothetical protein RBT61_00885 [Candidatus Kapabacteria bacterium]|nr:hypothetical protein [Candidatus Kapabacteria bacterium]
MRPLYIIPTHRATIETLLICDKLFRTKHQNHNRENAFRHALWNIIIAKNCYTPKRGATNVIEWAEKITTLHEKMAPNKPLETAMDLHNNKVGLTLFEEEKLYQKPLSEIKKILLQKMELGVKVNSEEEIKQHTDKMVYLE